ncbi:MULTISPECIES: hypothetical protein [Microbacterium]|uniref:hypothetical protein n=1 Tax=Microbacterium TaxID=33882 RepID=UPI002789139F|nr:MULTISPECIES: hypothetical protein [Microbacterium]MDQ1076360.1 hypothetical protein [Microbacterium sp. SORGH_AS_0969]MDQ1116597.1 hypothetical protein [Microbacterium testaceum]
MTEALPTRGAVFWPVGTGDSTTLVISEELVMQIDLHDMAKADSDDNPERPVVDELAASLPVRDGRPYLAVFALTHADKDHCLGFADLLDKVTIGELWATPRLWREYLDGSEDGLCKDAQAFQEEAERRVAAVLSDVADGRTPQSGDRIIVFGYDTDHDKHAYDELPAEFKSGPGKSVTALDGVDCSDVFEAFIHAPFAADAAASRNETSLAMQVTLRDESGVDGKLLLFGDLAHDTIMKIMSYSEEHERTEKLQWDLLLAPHHCSKKVMYLKSVDGTELLLDDVLDKFVEHQRDGAVIVSSSHTIPDEDSDGANPPHKMAADRYREMADELLVTMDWLDVNEPSPIVFGVSAAGAGIVRDETVELAASANLSKELAFANADSRLATVLARASILAGAVASTGTAVAAASGPAQVRQATSQDRGGDAAPATAVGFGQ